MGSTFFRSNMVSVGWWGSEPGGLSATLVKVAFRCLLHADQVRISTSPGALSAPGGTAIFSGREYQYRLLLGPR
jgi:hypothetical protein